MGEARAVGDGGVCDGRDAPVRFGRILHRREFEPCIARGGGGIGEPGRQVDDAGTVAPLGGIGTQTGGDLEMRVGHACGSRIRRLRRRFHVFAIAGHHLEGDVLRREFALRGVGHPCNGIGSVVEKPGEIVPREPRRRPRGAVRQVENVGNGIGRFKEERHADRVFRVFCVAIPAHSGIRRVVERKRDGAGFPVHLGREHCAGNGREGVGGDDIGQRRGNAVAVTGGKREDVFRVGAPGGRRGREGTRRQVGNGALGRSLDGPRRGALSEAGKKPVHGERDGVRGGAGRRGAPHIKERVDRVGGCVTLLLQRVARRHGKGVARVLGEAGNRRRLVRGPIAHDRSVDQEPVFDRIVEIDRRGGKIRARGGRLDGNARGDRAEVVEFLAAVLLAGVVFARGCLARDPLEALVGRVAPAGGEERLAAGRSEIHVAHGVGRGGAGCHVAVGIANDALGVDEAHSAVRRKREPRVRRMAEHVETAAGIVVAKNRARRNRIGSRRRGCRGVQIRDFERPPPHVLPRTTAELDERLVVGIDLVDPDALDAPGDEPVLVRALHVADARPVGRGADLGVVREIRRVRRVLFRPVAGGERRLRPAVEDADERVALVAGKGKEVGNDDLFRDRERREICRERGDRLPSVERRPERDGDVRRPRARRHHREARLKRLPRLRRQRQQIQIRHVRVVLERKVDVVEVEVAA